MSKFQDYEINIQTSVAFLHTNSQQSKKEIKKTVPAGLVVDAYSPSWEAEVGESLEPARSVLSVFIMIMPGQQSETLSQKKKSSEK